MNRSKKTGDKGEQIVSDVLDSINEKHYLINNLILLGDSGVSHQMDHILITKNGVFVIETKNYFGTIIGSEQASSWSHEVIKHGKKVNQRLPNPIRQNQSHLKAVRRVIGKGIPIYGFVVFVKDNASSLGIFSVCDLSDLKRKIAMCFEENELTPLQMESLYKKLLYSEADVNEEGHLESIKKVKENRIKNQNAIRFAIENRKCPECNKPIQIKEGLIHCLSCGFNAKLR